MKRDDLLQTILDSYDDSNYPEEFVNEYDIMECLSDHDGICTFLVQDKAGKNCIAKCYERSKWGISDNSKILNSLDRDDLPKHIATYESDTVTVILREYIEGISLSRYATENNLSEREIVQICIRLCDILGYLHHREAPIIHRDIKPQNIIVRPDGSIVLIDFDIARIYRSGSDTDTMFFGTLAYAPPEQYGFSQTDARTDIYSLGILLRWLLTGSTRDNKNIKVYRPLERVIVKCTGFAPKERFSDVSQVKRSLLHANPKAQGLRMAANILCAALAVGLIAFAGVKIYQTATYTPFTDNAIPAYMSDEERIADAVAYMREKYDTDMFDRSEEIATVGDLRAVLIELYGYERDYVYGFSTGIPEECDEYFIPWNWNEEQTVDRDIAVYVAVKAHDRAMVADWSSIKDDNGYYPGMRVAMNFAEETGIITGANRPRDILLGELALILANTDRVFDAAAK